MTAETTPIALYICRYVAMVARADALLEFLRELHETTALHVHLVDLALDDLPDPTRVTTVIIELPDPTPAETHVCSQLADRYAHATFLGTADVDAALAAGAGAWTAGRILQQARRDLPWLDWAECVGPSSARTFVGGILEGDVVLRLHRIGVQWVAATPTVTSRVGAGGTAAVAVGRLLGQLPELVEDLRRDLALVERLAGAVQ